MNHHETSIPIPHELHVHHYISLHLSGSLLVGALEQVFFLKPIISGTRPQIFQPIFQERHNSQSSLAAKSLLGNTSEAQRRGVRLVARFSRFDASQLRPMDLRAQSSTESWRVGSRVVMGGMLGGVTNKNDETIWIIMDYNGCCSTCQEKLGFIMYNVVKC